MEWGGCSAVSSQQRSTCQRGRLNRAATRTLGRARSPLAGWLVAPRMHSRHMRCRQRQPLGMVSSGPRRDGRMNGQTCRHLWDGTG